MVFIDRHDAGRQLAQKLLRYKDKNPVVVAIPRGGVVLGYEAAKAIGAPLDIIITRKLTSHFNPELGIGAIAPRDVKIFDYELITYLKISNDTLDKIVNKANWEMQEKERLYRGEFPELDLSEKTVIVIDDGIATGVSDRAAVLSLRKMNPAKIILAVPVCSAQSAIKFRNDVDQFVCLLEPEDFYAVGTHYHNFEQVTDDEVINLLKEAKG